MNEVKNLLIGIELTEQYAQLSYFDRKLKDPVSVPMRVGTNLYRFSMSLTRLKGRDEWRIGYEAEYFHKSDGEAVLVNPCALALAGRDAVIEGRTYSPKELLAAYILEMLRFLGLPSPVAAASGIGVACEPFTRAVAETVREALLLAGFLPGQCFIADFAESFYYYGFSQKNEYAARGLGLIRFFGDEVRFYDMSERRNVRPHTAELTDGPSGTLPKEPGARDEAFASMIGDWLKERSLSSVYLTGEGFDTAWAKSSLKVLSRASAHVFEGDNLFAKGAVWMVLEKLERHAFVGKLYLGPALMRATVGIYALEGGREYFLPLIEAGRSCYQEPVHVDILLEGQRELAFFVRGVGRKDGAKHVLPLTGLPERPDRTTRIRLTLSTPDENVCHIDAEDLGFGELFEASGLCYALDISLNGEENE